MKKFLIAGLFTVIAAFVFAQERIAVLPFEDMGNVLTQSEMTMFYREFSNAFTNQSAGRFAVVPRMDIERLINVEMEFQLSDFASREMTAEMQRVLAGTQILSGSMGRLGNNIRITVSLFTFPELHQLPGGTTISAANTIELFDRIPELVRQMMDIIAAGSGARPAALLPAGRAGDTIRTRTGGIEFVWIPAGSFQMGQAGIATPAHQVTLTQGFFMGRFEVTQDQWREVMTGNRNGISATPSSFSSNPSPGEVQGRRPVESVSWYDVIVFANRLSIMEGLTPAYRIGASTNPDDWGQVPRESSAAWDAVQVVPGSTGFRLPTEAQWEYAARAGTTTAWSYGNTANGNYMWFSQNSGSRTRQVGIRNANPWGLYDMHGNVWEWVWDWWGSYTAEAKTDPTGASSGSVRVCRGGSWNNTAENTRSANRNNNNPFNRNNNIGFRLVRP